jgi:hypothetical protein
MSSAADWFHPGLSPESSSMLLQQAGLLACSSSTPSRRQTVVFLLRAFGELPPTAAKARLEIVRMSLQLRG